MINTIKVFLKKILKGKVREERKRMVEYLKSSAYIDDLEKYIDRNETSAGEDNWFSNAIQDDEW